MIHTIVNTHHQKAVEAIEDVGAGARQSAASMPCPEQRTLHAANVLLQHALPLVNVVGHHQHRSWMLNAERALQHAESTAIHPA